MSAESEQEFLELLAQSAQWFRNYPAHEIIIVHHNDADGLSSGAILQSAFYRESRKVRRISLEKTYPDAIAKIIESIDIPSRAMLVFADFASGIIPIIEKMLPPDLSALILDHHQLSESKSGLVRIVNPVSFGISGRAEATASTVCYLFAKVLNSWNTDLALNALIGVIGDGQYQSPFLVQGLNRIPLVDAQESGAIVLTPELLTAGDPAYSLIRIVSAVNALGSIGYFEGGTDIAVKGLADGWGVEVELVAQRYVERANILVEKFFQQVSLQQRGRLCWFVLGGDFERCGVKTVGLLCEELIRHGRVDPDAYVLGIQPVPIDVPGVGRLSEPQDKVSMRVSPNLLLAIEAGKALPLTEILPPIVRGMGGLVDACHPHAAAVTIDPGKRSQLIDEVAALVN